MKIEKIDLYKYFGIERKGKELGYLYAYVIEQYDYCPKRIRPAMLVIPGGGYIYCSDREKEPIAFKYIAEGYSAFVLDYSVLPVHFPAQLLEGCMAMAYIRENAEKFGIDKEHVSAIGFSAGGHLCGMLATMWNEKEIKEILGDRVALCRPDAVILSYAVINPFEGKESKNLGSIGSFINLCGGKDEELFDRLSIDKRVDKNSAPAFIWTTVNDEAVPVENSLDVARAYNTAGVPFELHVYTDGQHGLALATEETGYDVKTAVAVVREPIQTWVSASVSWLKELGFRIKVKE